MEIGSIVNATVTKTAHWGIVLEHDGHVILVQESELDNVKPEGGPPKFTAQGKTHDVKVLHFSKTTKQFVGSIKAVG